MTNQMAVNPIVKYVVRRPGEASWSEHKGEKTAQRERDRANRTVQPGHCVYAVHKNGDVSGPY